MSSVFHEYFVLSNELHDFNTRYKFDIHSHVSKTAYGQCMIRFSGPAIGNKLPDYLKEASSAYTFRNKFKVLIAAQIVHLPVVITVF